MKTSLQNPFPSIRPILMSFHADQIQAEMAFCSSGQFSLHGPDKSRHCTITSHKSVSVPHCAEWMNYWTGAVEKDIRTHINTSAGTFAHTQLQSSCLGLIIRWAWGMFGFYVDMWKCFRPAAVPGFELLPEECKQCLSDGVKFGCLTWDSKTVPVLVFWIPIEFLNLNCKQNTELQSEFKEVELK